MKNIDDEIIIILEMIHFETEHISILHTRITFSEKN